MKYALTLFVALGVLTGTVATVAGTPQQPVTVDPTYRVGPSDELKVSVFDEPTLSGTFRVDSDGSIALPLANRVAVAGLTVQEVEKVLTEALAQFVRRPQVNVEISQFRSRSVFIMGEVRTPGKYALDSDVTLLELLALAGTLTESAGDDISVRRPKAAQGATGASLPEDPQSAEVFRVRLSDLQSGRSKSNLVLQDGDTIFVPAAPRVFVTGMVKNPGAVVLRGKLTVQQAIALAGGLTDRGSTRGIKIRREVTPGNYKEIDAKMTDFVQPNDTIQVRQRRI